MDQNQNHPSLGLKPHVPSKWDYSHHRTFGAFPLEAIPDEYILPAPTLNQGPAGKCTSYSTNADKDARTGEQFDADWFYEQEGEVVGKASNDGYDMTVALETACKRGYKPISGDTSRDPKSFADDSYFRIDGPYDLFDNIRATMMMAGKEKQSALLGALWYKEWTYSPNGIIKDKYDTQTPLGLHMFRDAGWTRNFRDGSPLPVLPNNEPYLAIQNTWGEVYGDKGWFYFPRSVVKTFLNEDWAYCLRSTPDPTRIKRMNIFIDILVNVIKTIKTFLLIRDKN